MFILCFISLVPFFRLTYLWTNYCWFHVLDSAHQQPSGQPPLLASVEASFTPHLHILSPQHHILVSCAPRRPPHPLKPEASRDWALQHKPFLQKPPFTSSCLCSSSPFPPDDALDRWSFILISFFFFPFSVSFHSFLWDNTVRWIKAWTSKSKAD